MLNISPTNSSKLAQSVQRDYYQAAEHHRLLKESGYQPTHTRTIVTVGLTLSSLIAAAVLITPFFAV